MDLLFLGNGFDLHYNLPTTYMCFLKVLECIRVKIEKGEVVNSVAQVLSDPMLTNIGAIQRCRQEYGADYDYDIDLDQLLLLVKFASSNLWFNYLLSKSLENDGWVDFEQEIGKVSEAFSVLFQSIKTGEDDLAFLHGEQLYSWRICYNFPFFFDIKEIESKLRYGGAIPLLDSVLPRYVCQMPSRIDVRCLNSKTIVEDLFDSLRELANILSLYLELFVDWPVKRMVDVGKQFYDRFIKELDWTKTRAVSLNYTHTLAHSVQPPERDTLSIYYIHGELERRQIVLGINADQKDDIARMDLTFLPFKKYSQRVYYNTDNSYLEFIANVRAGHSDLNTLFVIGHSLDATDKDIISECFNYAQRIVVFYHKETEVAKYIHNLVAIYGKQGFDNLRLVKRLRFAPIEDMNLNPIAFKTKYKRQS